MAVGARPPSLLRGKFSELGFGSGLGIERRRGATRTRVRLGLALRAGVAMAFGARADRRPAARRDERAADPHPVIQLVRGKVLVELLAMEAEVVRAGEFPQDPGIGGQVGGTADGRAEGKFRETQFELLSNAARAVMMSTRQPAKLIEYGVGGAGWHRRVFFY